MNRFISYYTEYYTPPNRVKRLEYLTAKYEAMMNNKYKKVIPMQLPRSVFIKKTN